MPVNFTLYYTAVAADNAWSHALELKYGPSAGDARYDKRGRATPELSQLAEYKLQSDAAWLAEIDRARSQKTDS